MLVLKLIILLLFVITTVCVKHKSKPKQEFDIKFLGPSVKGRYLYRLTMGNVSGNASYSEHHLWPECSLETTIGFSWKAPDGRLVNGVDMDVLTGANQLYADSSTGLRKDIFRARVLLPKFAKITLFSLFVHTIGSGYKYTTRSETPSPEVESVT